MPGALQSSYLIAQSQSVSGYKWVIGKGSIWSDLCPIKMILDYRWKMMVFYNIENISSSHLGQGQQPEEDQPPPEHSRATYFDISSNTFIVLAELRLFIGLNHVLALIPIKLISLLYLAQPSTNIWLRNTYIVANSHRLCKSVVCKSGILFTAVLMTYIWKQQQTVSWCLCKPNNSWSSVFLRVQSLLTVVTD